MKEQSEDLAKLRQFIHQHPEISGEEQETAAYLLSRIRNFNPTEIIKGLAGNGFLVVFDSGEEGPSLLFRAELDGLPIHDTLDAEHRSIKEGKGHQCGHDGHMTILFGLAEYLSANPILHGKVSLLFQPAEETGEGAEAVIKDSKFKSLHFDEVFALHNLPGEDLGSIVLKSGAFTAAVKSIIIKLKGKTAHAAEPENGINPALAVAKILQFSEDFSQKLPEREDFSLITPVYVSLGEKAYGVSAGEAEVHFTYRCWTNQQLNQLESKLLNVINDVAKEYQLEVEYEFLQAFYANENLEESVAAVRNAAQKLDFNIVEKATPFKWGEDFGFFTQQFKGCLFGLGSGVNQPALHHPDYDFPDELIPFGIEIFKEIIHQKLNHV